MRGGWAYGMTLSNCGDNIDSNWYNGRLNSARSVNYGINKSATLSGAPANARPFNSNHPGGANFALADGSTRYVADTVLFEVLTAFASMDQRDTTTGLD